MSSRRFILSAFALTLALGLSAGCGHAPTAPVGVVTQEAAAPAAAVKPAAQSDGLLSDLVGGVLRLVVRTLDLVGEIGGSLTNGRCRVDVPAGAVEGEVTVSMAVSSAVSPVVELEITPADQNHFAVPVTLSVSCRGVSDRELRDYVLYWWNPSTGTWDEVAGSQVDLRSRTVRAPLHHFSRYAVGPKGGKASW